MNLWDLFFVFCAAGAGVLSVCFIRISRRSRKFFSQILEESDKNNQDDQVCPHCGCIIPK